MEVSLQAAVPRHTQTHTQQKVCLFHSRQETTIHKAADSLHACHLTWQIKVLKPNVVEFFTRT